MRKTDISNYKAKSDSDKKGLPPAVKAVLSGVLKTLLTLMLVFFIAGVIVCFNIFFYLMELSAQPSGIDLDARSLNLSSFVYVQDEETGEFYEYETLYGTENRVWVDYNEIPQAMINAQIAIEDKRFYEHKGVDWLRTGEAMLNLAGGDDSFGASTITQQLIKNLTEDDEVSINRKIREIIKALKVEKEYTKDEIIEAYLNVVNFGGSCQGVQAAAQRYFGKDITDCSVAECAAIAGITQNPSKWDPLVYPENNYIRREDVLFAMHSYGYLTDEEYQAAMEESENMTFRDYSGDEEDNDTPITIQNWYFDELVFDLSRDLAKVYNISEDAALDKIYSEGLKIYCAMDVEAQKIIEEEALNINKSNNPDLEIGMTMMDYTGRVIATVGSSNEKDANLLFDRASMSILQPGSSIKPVVAYAKAVDEGLINWSSVISDQPLDTWIYSDGTKGPNNWYGYNHKNGLFLVDAIEWSSNACAANTVMTIGGPDIAYEHAVNYLGFDNLNREEDMFNTAAFSLGGMNGGVTVREMAAAYAYIGNGGMYYEPYTYYYVTDRNDKVILDNRNNIPIQAYSSETASIMNRLLHYNVNNCAHTSAAYANVYGWEIAGKTGTTNEDKDSWFCGGSPYATLAVWTGFDDPHRIYSPGTAVAAQTFSNVMSRYLEDKEYKEFDLDEGIEYLEFCTHTGKLATSICKDTRKGWYTSDNKPGNCTSHSGVNISADEDDTTAATTEATEATFTEGTVSIDLVEPTAPTQGATATDPAEE
ncbi:MAG: penicillin-binding protein [Ruminococcus sp.]|nr:penicillin-binding protein [Ruminococcus sp.]